MGFTSWARSLDERVLGPVERRWDPLLRRHGAERLGLITLLIFGGGFILRLLLPRPFHASGWILAFYGGMATMGLLVLIDARRRTRSRDRY